MFEKGKQNPVLTVNEAISYAKAEDLDYILVDTAGRLHIDENLMDELENIRKEINPNEIILVLDGMIGQDAINVIKGFNEKITINWYNINKDGW